MNFDVPRLRTTRRSFLQTPLKRSNWYNEIEKRKAIKNNTYPTPASIKNSLGKHLGQIVIDTIPKHVLEKFTAESDSSYLPTPVSNNDDAATSIKAILRVGEHLKGKVLSKLEDEHNDAMEILLNKLKNERNRDITVQILNIIDSEEERYELETVAVTDKYKNEFLETKKSIEEYIANKCTIKLEKKSARIMHKMKKLLISSAEEKEKELRDTFDYHMQLARNELFERFQNEKFKLAHQWEEEIKTLRDKNKTVLEQLQKCLETKHAQDLIKLEQRYENMQNKTVPIQVNDKAVEDEDEVDDDLLHRTLLHIRQMDNELLEKNRELFIYRNRLKNILNGYIDFAENNSQANTTFFKNQLKEAKNFMAKLSKTESGRIEEYENFSCAS